jgi:peptidoglycan hydrolase-like protein with peptidoglycan-binding domain
LRETSKSSSESVSESSKDTIKIGDRGEAVTVVQKRLAEIGIRSGEEGVFDQATQEAVRQFQQGKGLTVDGIVGEQTLAALPQIGESKLPAVDESQAMPAPKETFKSPAVDEAQPTPATKKTTKWYEDNSAPLTPFTK